MSRQLINHSLDKCHGGGKLRVAIIGAGYSGLCSLHHFAGDKMFEVVLFEQSSRIGGVWNYPEGCDATVVQNPTSPFYTRMYKNLKTNLPTDLMTLEGFPFPTGTKSYCDVKTITRYLEDYAQHFQLGSHIKLEHRIINVVPILSDKEAQRTGAIGPRWTVTYENMGAHSRSSEVFDSVIVCAGKYHALHIPEINGLERYTGSVLHSSEYRNPERFRNKTVLIIGGGASAKEIAIDLALTAHKVIIAKRKSESIFRSQLPNVFETAIPNVYNEREVILNDGSSFHIDAIILCTGYRYDFPFLSAECLVEASRGRVSPLYRHLVHCVYPSMAFPLLLTLVPITPFLDCQVKYFKALLDGKTKLPSTEDMLLCTANDYQQRLQQSGGNPRQVAHGFPQEKGWAYVTELGQDGGFHPYDPVIQEMTKVAFESIFSGNLTYKDDLFQCIDSFTFKHVKAASISDL